jgi:hypothetical protein
MGSNRPKHGGDQEESPEKQLYSAPYRVYAEVLHDLTAVLTSIQGGVPRAGDESAQDYIGKGVLLQPHRPRTVRERRRAATIAALSASRINFLRIRSSLGLCKDDELLGVS